jgi:hypothetical protein
VVSRLRSDVPIEGIIADQSGRAFSASTVNRMHPSRQPRLHPGVRSPGEQPSERHVELPKRRLTVFTGVSGSGKSSLVFDTIAAESQRLINETYSAFVQGFMPTLARPDVDVLEGLTTAIIVDQERMGANVRSTVGTVTDANTMLRILFSRLGEPHIGSPQAFAFNVPSVTAAGSITVAGVKARPTGRPSPAPEACARVARAWARSATSTSASCTTTARPSPKGR